MHLVAPIKRVNFNMEDECHALLKGACALQGVTVSDFIYDLIATKFEELVASDTRIHAMFMRGTYPEGSRCIKLRKRIEDDILSKSSYVAN